MILLSLSAAKLCDMLNTDLLNKLQDLKRQTDVSKDRLEDIVITEESGGGLVRISMNGNRKLTSFEITGDHAVIEKEELEDLVSVAINRVLDKVNDLNETEVMSSAQSLFSGI
ncbi:MAG: DNA-binding protein YbaB [Crocinitomicaceae bacterium]